MNNIWSCYILYNNDEKDKNRTYNGMTNKISRRIRQHNKEIKGGARYTSKYGNNNWEYLVIVNNIPDKITALQMEWRIKKPTGKKIRPQRYNNPFGRIIGLLETLNLEYVTNNCKIKTIDMNLEVSINKNYYDKTIQYINKQNYNYQNIVFKSL